MDESTGVAVSGHGEMMGGQMDAPEDTGSLVRYAIDKGVDVEMLERLVALQERVMDRNAEQAMAEALAGFQGDCPAIPKTGTADVRKNGKKQYSYDFAKLDVMIGIIRPHLARYGLSFTHDSEIVDGEISVTCTLQHVAGATRTATFRGPLDKSGGKNPIQEVASSRSYGRRYTLADVLGLATGDDTDGVAEPRQIEEQEIETLNLRIEALGWESEKFAAFLRWLDVESMDQITMESYPKALSFLERKRVEAELAEAGA